MARALAIDARLSFASGIGTYLRHLLAGGVADGLDVLLLDPSAGRLSVSGAATLRRVPVAAPILRPAEQWAIPRALRSHDGVLWVPHFNIPLAHRGDLVVTLHDIAQLDGRPRLGDRAWFAYGRTLLRAIARRARIVLADSSFTRDAFLDFTGCDAAGARVVSLGVDTEWFEATANPPVASAAPYFLYVGNVKLHKNVAGLLRAFSTLLDACDHDLVIVGPTAGLRSRDEEALRLASRLEARVRVLGRVDGDSLGSWMAGASCLVLPSFCEGFGLPPLEAMAAGCPALVARAGALPEVCGDAALYCDPHDESDIAAKLLRLATDDALAADLRARGRLRAREFRWSETVRQTRAALDELL